MQRWLKRGQSIRPPGVGTVRSTKRGLVISYTHSRRPSSDNTTNTIPPIAALKKTPTSKLVVDADRKLRTKHLLRAILRECTYLPDSQARGWAAQYALSRFRTYGFKIWTRRANPDFVDRLTGKESEARKWLSTLRRANDGEYKCLLKVLLMTYGRLGKRRYELMRPLMSVKESKSSPGAQSDAGVTSEEEDAMSVEELDDLVDTDTSTQSSGSDRQQATLSNSQAEIKHDLDLTPQLRALLNSQIRTTPPTLTRSNPRRLQAVIPKLNSWHRPMPQKRINNMKLKHYAQLLDRTLPPLSEDEWTRVRDLATGQMPCGPVLPRRRRQSLVSTDFGHDSSTPASALELVVRYGKVPTNAVETSRGHAFTQRYMRRLYTTIFSQCPMVKLDTATTSWIVKWGGRASQDAIAGRRHSADEATIPDLHGGVDGDGQIDSPIKSTK